MLKLVTTNGTPGQPEEPVTIFLGLSFGNLDRLRDGQPILFDLAEIQVGDLLPQGKVVILAGDTEQSIVDDLRQHGMDIPGEVPEPG